MKFNRDVLYLISKNLQNDSISLYSFLLVSRIWYEVAVPILWKIPGRIPLTKKAESILFNVILSHFSEDSRDILKKQGINDLFTEAYRPLSFNYIIFWRHLDLEYLEDMIKIKLRNDKEPNINIIINELLKLFINKNTKFLSLFIPYNFKYQLHNISWAEQCFSSLKFLRCDSRDKNIMEGTNWYHLKKVFLPGLKVLIANTDSHKNLDRMIKITICHLLKITICNKNFISDSDYNRRLIQAIYQNCPNLRYLNMPIKEQNIPEFEISSPISLYKFKIYFNQEFGPNSETLKSFFDNWKDRHPMILQIHSMNFEDMEELKGLAKKYELKGIVQRCDFNCVCDYEEFDWVEVYLPYNDENDLDYLTCRALSKSFDQNVIPKVMAVTSHKPSQFAL
ncbi:2238_t:CDS:2 [Rhizophagus irregularis]|nr:2238_t:CDS:2 [Rhizophagus irregularis]